MRAHVSTGARGQQSLISLKLERQVVVSDLAWVLGFKLGSSSIAVHAPNRGNWELDHLPLPLPQCLQLSPGEGCKGPGQVCLPWLPASFLQSQSKRAGWQVNATSFCLFTSPSLPVTPFSFLSHSLFSPFLPTLPTLLLSSLSLFLSLDLKMCPPFFFCIYVSCMYVHTCDTVAT